MMLMHEGRQECIEPQVQQQVVAKALKEMFVRRRDAKYQLISAKGYSKSG